MKLDKFDKRLILIFVMSVIYFLVKKFVPLGLHYLSGFIVATVYCMNIGRINKWFQA